MNFVTYILIALIAVGLVWTVICAREIDRVDQKKRDWEKEAKKHRPSRP